MLEPSDGAEAMASVGVSFNLEANVYEAAFPDLVPNGPPAVDDTTLLRMASTPSGVVGGLGVSFTLEANVPETAIPDFTL